VSAIELVSPLPPDECAARLREATDNEGLRSSFGARPVIGRVSRRSVRLRKRIGFRDSWKPLIDPVTQSVTMASGRAEESYRRAAYWGALRGKYERAARRPWLPVEPDPPQP
jgi:hypothetical protein